MAYSAVTLRSKREVHVIPCDDVLPHQEDGFCLCSPLPEKAANGWTIYCHSSFADEEVAIAQGLLESALGLTKPAALVRRELIV